MNRLRPVDTARLVAGAVALGSPQLLIRVTGSADGLWPRRVTRLLGARYLLQSGGGALLGRPWVPAADAAVDLLHALSMVGLAAASPGHRRLASSSALVALGFAVADLGEGAA